MPSPVQFVYAFAEKDRAFYLELRKTIEPIKKLNDNLEIIECSRDTIPYGADVNKETQQFFKRANVIFLLFSLDYLVSEHFNFESTFAQQKHKEGSAIIIPINLKDTSSLPDIIEKYFGAIRYLPKDGSPIQSPENTGAFKEIGDEVRKILQQKLPSPGKSKPVMTIDDLEDSLKHKLEGQYRDFTRLKDGHLVTVFKATDYYLKRDVVIKAINPWIEIEEDIRHKLEEAEMEFSRYSCFRHRHIKVIYSGRLDDDLKYIIIEHVHGSTIKEIISREGRQPPWEIKKILTQMCDAIYYGHQRKLIHNYINPSNVYIDEELNVVISPFRILNTSSLVGEYTQENLSYWSPEVIESCKEVKENSDQFSIGLIAFELVTGAPLFKGANVVEIIQAREQIKLNPDVISKELKAAGCPRDIANIIITLLKFDPELRFKTVGEVIKSLGKVSYKIDEDAETALRSYERSCAAYPKLIPSFYSRLFGAYPYLKEGVFKGVEIEQQFIKLHHAINILLEIKDNPISRNQSSPKNNNENSTLQRVAHTHERIHIKKEDYFNFRDIFLDVLSEKDAEWNAGVKNAWLKLFDKGIEHMLHNYLTPQV